MENPVLFWNAVALECNRLDHTGMMRGRNQQGPTLSSRALAIVHIAIHDAYVLAKRQIASPATPNDPYLPVASRPAFNKPPGPNSKLVSAAVSAAASSALLTLYPELKRTITEAFDKICEINGDDEGGHRFGVELARNVILLRAGDGSSHDPDPEYPVYVESAAYGRHREDPLNRDQPFLGADYGRTKLFACNTFHGLAKHPDIGNPAYMVDHREVRDKGVYPSAKNITRMADETVAGIYWAYDGANQLGTPPRLYNQILRAIAAKLALNEDQINRMLFLANIAMGDAGVHAWFYKYHFDLWRPVVGIREFDDSMGPATMDPAASPIDPDCDPFWRPLGAPRTNMADASVRTFTPPFPAYPSGHATFGAAAFHVARLYLKSIGKAVIAANGTDNIAFDFVSDEMNGKSLDPDKTVRTRHLRRFPGLHEAIYENSVSRIFLGVHWRFDGTTGTNAVSMLAAADNIGGVPLGIAIAEDIFAQANINPSPNSTDNRPFQTMPMTIA